MNCSRYYKHANLLFSPDLLRRVAEHSQKFCTDKDFPVKKGLSVRDEAQRAFRIAKSAWAGFQAARSDKEDGSEAQNEFIRTIICDVLGYEGVWELPPSGIPVDESCSLSRLLNARLGQLRLEDIAGDAAAAADPSSADEGSEPALFPISWLLDCDEERSLVPAIVVPPNAGLDAKFSFATGHRLSPTQMMQAYLNASKEFSWALVTNGSNWRLLRDNPSLSRPCYLDIDLGAMLDGEGDSAAFDSVFWRMLHVSRAVWQNEGGSASCLWEQWRRDLEEHGARARNGLREGVEAAICRLGTGFLRSNGSGNAHLRKRLAEGALGTQDFYCQLLRLAYRLIFLSVLEDRELLHAHNHAAKEAAQTYAKGYSLARLTQRAMSSEQSESRYDDLWQAQLIVFRGLGRDGGLPELALPALGGLFDSGQCPDLDACRLPNAAFLSALHFLRWTSTDNKRTLIDYINMDAEELGSVYESLLELTPRISFERQLFYFAGGAADPSAASKKQKGNARKTTGSYYTPSCLVELAIKTSLDPLLDDCCKNPAYANNRILALRVIDPACGSGHFLLAAARRMAERLAEARTQGQLGYTPQVFRQAMHDVVRNCIYGVDINPMAVELARMNLWLEGYLPGKALPFLDDRLRCGDSLLGIFDADSLSRPIPDAAFKCAPGDDKEVCKRLAASNRLAAKGRLKSNRPLWSWGSEPPAAKDYRDDQPSQVLQQACDWQERQGRLRESRQAVAADMWLGAFLVPKTGADSAPTTRVLDDFLSGILDADAPPIRAARQACRDARAFHWFLEFPEVFRDGGFDCVLGNPPWKKVQLKEEEWFAERNETIAKASGATRKNYIALLSKGLLGSTLKSDGQNEETTNRSEIALYQEYQQNLRISNASSAFFHTSGEKGGRFPLTGTGGINVYALFSETAYYLKSSQGRVGIIVPTGIATDDSTSAFFRHVVETKEIESIIDFYNREKIYPSIPPVIRFCCFALGSSESFTMACYIANIKELEDERRFLSYKAEDLAEVNPNTGTCPLFRCTEDAELAVKIYRSVPILWNEQTGENPWRISFKQGLFNMTSGSSLFHEEKPENALPLYEGKLIHHYDHRFNTFDSTGAKATERAVPAKAKRDPHYAISPRYWVKRSDVIAKLHKCCKEVPKWFIGFRDITNVTTSNRTLIMSFIPFAGVGNKCPLAFMPYGAKLQCCFVANGDSIVLDYIVRLKFGGTSMNYFYVKQFPFLPPTAYSEADIAYISSRVLELSYTSWSMQPLAEALGYGGEPFGWDEDRRALLKAELDAYYAKLYGLTRDELAYILEPETRYPNGCPTATFPGLRNNELKQYGEYRTRRLVLAAFDALEQQGK